MASKNCMWALLAFCGSLLTVSAAQAADPPSDQGARKAKPDTVTCRYVDSPGSRVKRHVCGTQAQPPPDNHFPVPGGSAASPPAVVPGMSDFNNPANQSAYKGFR
jgi:hypothetical protein